MAKEISLRNESNSGLVYLIYLEAVTQTTRNPRSKAGCPLETLNEPTQVKELVRIFSAL